MKRLVAIGSLVLLPIGVPACRNDDAATSTFATVLGTAAPATSAASVGSFNDADVTFAQQMIPHHRQAIEMAEIALDPTVAAGPDVVALAGQIKAAQDPEIEQMTSWLQTWGQSTSDTIDMSHGEPMGGMMTDEGMRALAAARGVAFDQLWLTGMISHHQGAIEMANVEQRDGQATEAVAARRADHHRPTGRDRPDELAAAGELSITVETRSMYGMAEDSRQRGWGPTMSRT